MSSAVQLQNSSLFDLHGHIALVSGGGTGIGLMITRGLAANGAKVYIGGRRKEVLETVAAELSVQGKGTVIPYVRLEIRSPAFVLINSPQNKFAPRCLRSRQHYQGEEYH